MIWIMVLTERDRLFISASVLPSPASAGVNRHAARYTEITTTILIAFHAPSDDSRTRSHLVFYHTRAHIRTPHPRFNTHLKKSSCIRVHAHNTRVTAIPEKRSPCGGACCLGCYTGWTGHRFPAGT